MSWSRSSPAVQHSAASPMRELAVPEPSNTMNTFNHTDDAAANPAMNARHPSVDINSSGVTAIASSVGIESSNTQRERTNASSRRYDSRRTQLPGEPSS